MARATHTEDLKRGWGRRCLQAAVPTRIMAPARLRRAAISTSASASGGPNDPTCAIRVPMALDWRNAVGLPASLTDATPRPRRLCPALRLYEAVLRLGACET